MNYQTDEFTRHFNLTLAWCLTRVNFDDPKNCLRSRELRPDLEAFGYGDDDIWIHPQLVDQVVRQRQYHFSDSGISNQFQLIANMPGRLLLVAQDYSNHNNLTSDITGGFFDYNDVPPWDTWVMLIEGNREGMTIGDWEGDWPPTLTSCLGYDGLMCWLLVTWVPEAFCSMVQEAIEAEAIGMMAWADDLPEKRSGIQPNFRRVVPRWLQNLMNQK